MSQGEVKRRLLLVGGGHAHIQVLHDFYLSPWPNTELTLICDQAMTPYSGMLPGYLAGYYEEREIYFDLPKLCQRAGVRFVLGEVVSVDQKAKRVMILNGSTLDYDGVSFDVGSKPGVPFSWDPSRTDILPLKPISLLIPRWQHLISQIVGANQSRSEFHVAMVGGGVSGVEVMLALAAKLKSLKVCARLSLWQKSPQLVPQHSALTRFLVMKQLKAKHIEWHCGVEARSFEDLKADVCLIATQAKSASWFRSSGLPVDADGFLKVNEHLEVPGHPGVFGAGDCIAFTGRHLPKSGVFAVRQGPILIHNLKARLVSSSKHLRPYKPQKFYLNLISVGAEKAIASWGPFGFSSARLLQIKSEIDRSFMKKFG